MHARFLREARRRLQFPPDKHQRLSIRRAIGISTVMMAPHSRILVLGHRERGIDFTGVYAYLSAQEDVDVVLLDKNQLRNLGHFLRSIDTSRYQRVVVDLPFAKLHKAARQLKRLPGLILYEEDACQNFIDASRWHGKFAELYRKLPHARLVLTGFSTANKFSALGFNTHFVPKGYDQQHLFVTDSPRDISLGFIGRTRSQVYSKRLALLDDLKKQFDIALLRTEGHREYRETLNRIRIFVSADINLGEYMAKNFEAMACGCAVLAYRQGHGEEEALGLKDMENIALYSSSGEAIAKIRQLMEAPELLQHIAENGRALVKEQYSHQRIAESLLQIARSAPSTSDHSPRDRGWIQRIKTRLGNK